MKIPGQARSSGFHICDILDLNDAKVHGADPNINVHGGHTLQGKRINFFYYRLATIICFILTYTDKITDILTGYNNDRITF